MSNWIKDARIYQIYPISFNDTNNDGIGDINGITAKLSYIRDMGFNAIWINPCFCSPFCDGGYDISNYNKVDKRFGINADLVKLFNEAEKKGIKVLLDLVPGHTSDKHKWFINSSRAKKNKYSDYYIWTDSVWTQCSNLPLIAGNSERDGRYALNFFLSQPALNYGFANPTEDWQQPWDGEGALKVRNEIINIILYWLKKGVAGFRVDMAFSLVKNDVGYEKTILVWQDIFKKVKAVFPNSIFISEWGEPILSARAGFDADMLILSERGEYTKLFRAEKGTNIYNLNNGTSYFRKNGNGNVLNFMDFYLSCYESIQGKSYICVPTGCHDVPRISFKRDVKDLMVAYAFIYSLPGLPIVYYGDEIAMPYVKNAPTKHGGYNRSGSRLFMEWNINDAERLMLREFVVALNNLRATEEALNVSSPIFIEQAGKNGYPLVFSRGRKPNRIICAFNPSDKEFEIDKPSFEILLGNSFKIQKSKALLKSRGFIIARERF